MSIPYPHCDECDPWNTGYDTVQYEREISLEDGIFTIIDDCECQVCFECWQVTHTVDTNTGINTFEKRVVEVIKEADETMVEFLKEIGLCPEKVIAGWYDYRTDAIKQAIEALG